MTQTDDERKRAEAFAKQVGGVLAVILGLRASASPIVWDAAAGRFRVGDQAVTVETLRTQMRRLETFAGVQMSKLADRLVRNEITLDEWLAGMKSIIASSHVLMAALAAGSIDAAAARPDVQDRIEKQQKYADGFAKAIPAKKLRLSTIKARAQSYMLAAAVTYAVVEQSVRAAVGFQYAMRTCTARESCDGCLTYAGEWIKIDEMPEIGSLDCGDRCRCNMDYS